MAGKNVLGIISACHYCGRIEPMTKDHKMPKAYRRLHPIRPSPYVYACLSCNKKKKETPYPEFMVWLHGSEAGRTYLQYRATRYWPRPTVSCDTPFNGRHTHYCGLKPCGVLRMYVVVLDNDDGLLWRMANERNVEPSAAGRSQTRPAPWYQSRTARAHLAQTS